MTRAPLSASGCPRPRRRWRGSRSEAARSRADGRSRPAGRMPASHREAGGTPGGDGETGSAWRPAVAPGRDSPCAPAPASSFAPPGARQDRPAGSRRRPRSRVPACCRTRAPGGAATWMEALGLRSQGHRPPRSGRNAGPETARLEESEKPSTSLPPRAWPRLGPQAA